MIFWRAWSRKWLPCGNIFRCNSVAFFPSVFSTSLPLLSYVSQVLHSRPGRPQSSTVYSTPLSEPQYISWMDKKIWSDTTGCLSCTSPTTKFLTSFSIFWGDPRSTWILKSLGKENWIFQSDSHEHKKVGRDGTEREFLPFTRQTNYWITELCTSHMRTIAIDQVMAGCLYIRTCFEAPIT